MPTGRARARHRVDRHAAFAYLSEHAAGVALVHELAAHRLERDREARFARGTHRIIDILRNRIVLAERAG